MYTVVIPAYKPNDKLITFCNDLKAANVKDILVVDDGSGEEYQSIFDAVRKIDVCTVLVHEVNMGKGKAMKDAFAYILENNPKTKGCVTADADGQHLTKDILNCIEAFESNLDSLVLGVRNFNLPGIPKKNRCGNLFTICLYRIFRGAILKDTQTGLRVYPANYMRLCMDVKGDRFDFETRALIEAINNKIPIIEVPIETVYEEKDKYVTHYSAFKDSIAIGAIVMEEAIKYAISAVSSMVIDLFLFWAFLHTICSGWESWSIVGATFFARACSSMYNYIINYKLVFRSKTSILGSVWKYYLLVVIQMFMSGWLVTLFVTNLHSNEVVTKFCVDAVLFIVNFFVQRKIFHTNKKG